jgi:hypothetical protein|tara:strand:+ start:523 stop:780 length:258 start_codon:yes stop_codon:yes gene_type:complete
MPDIDFLTRWAFVKLLGVVDNKYVIPQTNEHSKYTHDALKNGSKRNAENQQQERALAPAVSGPCKSPKGIAHVRGSIELHGARLD